MLDIGYSNYGECDLSDDGTTIGLDLDTLDHAPFPQIKGDVRFLPFKDESIDRVTVSHVLDLPGLLAPGKAEILRVLKPGGEAVALFWIGKGRRVYRKGLNRSRGRSQQN